jgi:hypothetical protein
MVCKGADDSIESIFVIEISFEKEARRKSIGLTRDSCDVMRYG